MTVDDAGLRRVQRGDAGERRLEPPRRGRIEHREPLDAVRLALPLDRGELHLFGRVRRDDQLAALAVRHVVRGAIGVKHAPPARAVDRAQRAGRVVHAGVDHLAVARGNAAADAGCLLGDDDIMAGERGRARNREPDDAGTDDQNLHGSEFSPDGPKRNRRLYAAVPAKAGTSIPKFGSSRVSLRSTRPTRRRGR